MFLTRFIFDSFCDKVKHSIDRRIDTEPCQEQSDLYHQQIHTRRYDNNSQKSHTQPDQYTFSSS